MVFRARAAGLGSETSRSHGSARPPRVGPAGSSTLERVVDYRIEQWINGPAGHTPLLDAAMVGIAATAEVAFAGLVLVWFLIGWWSDAAPLRQEAIAALLAAGGALAVNAAVGLAWYRPRPFAAHPGTVHVLLPHAADSSFPSDHAAAAFAIAVVLVAAHRPWGVAALALAALVGYARIYVGDHYPTDILAGGVVGCAAGILLVARLSPVPRRAREATDLVMRRLRLPRAPSPRDGPMEEGLHRPR